MDSLIEKCRGTFNQATLRSEGRTTLVGGTRAFTGTRGEGRFVTLGAVGSPTINVTWEGSYTAGSKR